MLMVSSCVNGKGEGLVAGYSCVRKRSLKNLNTKSCCITQVSNYRRSMFSSYANF